MATTATIDHALIPLSDMPRTKAAQNTFCQLDGELGAVTEKLSRYLTTLAPRHEPTQHFSDDDVYEARQHKDETQRDHARLSQAVAAARAALDTAKEADREELHRRERVLLRADAPNLLAAARGLETAMVRFRGIQVKAHQCTGDFMDACGPSGFLPSSGNGQRVGEVELLEDALRQQKLID